MDLIQSIWLSTVAGAGLFLGAGYVAGKGLSSKPANDGSPELLQAEKDARQQAEARATALEQQHATLTQSLEGERSRAQEAQKLREQLGQLQAELNKARSAAAGPSPAEAQLRQENADLRQRVASNEQAAHAYATERARAQDLEQRLAAAMAQAGAAHGHDAQRHDLEQRLAAAHAEVQTARAHAEQLRASAQRADQLAAENAQLKSRPAAGGSDKLATELATEKAKVAQLQNQVVALQKTTENTGKLASDLTTEKTKVRDLELKLAAAQKGSGDSAKLAQDLAAEKAKVQQLQTQIASLQQAANEAARLGLELANTRTKVNELEAKLAKAPAGGGSTIELDRLRGENNSLRGELDLMKRTAISQKDHDALKKTNNETALRMRTLEQRASETDYYANENSDLRRRVEELETIALEAKQMRRRITDLEAQAFAIAAQKTKDKSAAGKAAAHAHAIPTGDEQRLEHLLEEAMSALVRDETGGRVAVLSDTRGLLIAASGEQKYSAELAAAASVVAEVAEKVRLLLPFAEPQTLVLSDVNNVIVRTRWLRLDDDILALSVLGFSDDMPNATEDKAAKAVTKLMTYT